MKLKWLHQKCFHRAKIKGISWLGPCMAPFFNRMEIQKGRCGKMSQDSGKGLRPRQYGGTNQLAEDRLERKAPMSRGLRQGG